MATKKLGVNQELDQLFNRVLNKPEYENQLHEFGDYIFAFSKATWFSSSAMWAVNNKVTKSEGYMLAIFESRTGKQPVELEVTEEDSNSFAGSHHHVQYVEMQYLNNQLPNRPYTSLYAGVSELRGDVATFREQFTKYLHMVDLRDKLELMPEKTSTTRKNKI
ncbi:hypothetical protein JAO10_09170 [Burkholderia contaminans]|uniref:hypothetical protein n=1 Tax=Burkholderia contaminans TaxID=488447 RepID=UPI0018DC1FB4|nr:hypothetical protein [Burkholderia contaminans]MBH9720502.1 hypothetical protein [Burkholderia contaminans]